MSYLIWRKSSTAFFKMKSQANRIAWNNFRLNYSNLAKYKKSSFFVSTLKSKAWLKCTARSALATFSEKREPQMVLQLYNSRVSRTNYDTTIHEQYPVSQQRDVRFVEKPGRQCCAF